MALEDMSTTGRTDLKVGCRCRRKRCRPLYVLSLCISLRVNRRDRLTPCSLFAVRRDGPRPVCQLFLLLRASPPRRSGYAKSQRPSRSLPAPADRAIALSRQLAGTVSKPEPIARCRSSSVRLSRRRTGAPGPQRLGSLPGQPGTSGRSRSWFPWGAVRQPLPCRLECLARTKHEALAPHRPGHARRRSAAETPCRTGECRSVCPSYRSHQRRTSVVASRGTALHGRTAA